MVAGAVFGMSGDFHFRPDGAMMPAMPDTADEFTAEERADVEAGMRRMLEQMRADPDRRPTDSPLDVPVDVLADAELKLRKLDKEIRAEQLAQDLVDRVARGEPLPAARRLTPAEAEAIDGPPYDEET